MQPEKSTQVTTKQLDGKVYPPVGKCIYCGCTEELEKEHILPLALSGTAILPKASCRKCASITGAVEQELLRGSFWPVRIFRNLKSRTKHKDAPVTFPMTFVRNGKEEVHHLKINELPILLHFPLLAPPGHLLPGTPTAGIQLSGFATVRFGKDPIQAVSMRGATGLQVSESHKPVAFARMIAKIAYAFAYAEGAMNDMDGEPFVLPAILGEKDDVGRWVGTLTDAPKSHPGTLHRIEVHHDRARGLLCAEVQLFSDSETPSYGVLLGRLKSNDA